MVKGLDEDVGLVSLDRGGVPKPGDDEGGKVDGDGDVVEAGVVVARNWAGPKDVGVVVGALGVVSPRRRGVRDRGRPCGPCSRRASTWTGSFQLGSIGGTADG